MRGPILEVWGDAPQQRQPALEYRLFMAILPIRLYPDPILRREARPVSEITAAIRKLARDMIETLDSAQGVGLAGNQVGMLRRMVALHVPEREPLVIINPEISHRDGERRIQEGCLSFPGYFGMVTRSMRVVAHALSTEGEPLKFDATELLAQALEHEIDHLNGMLFIDHVQAHEDLWKAGEDNGVHEHGDIDFEHEADHGRVLTAEERDESRKPAMGPGESHEDDGEEEEPFDYTQLAPYRQADFAAFESALRELREKLTAQA